MSFDASCHSPSPLFRVIAACREQSIELEDPDAPSESTSSSSSDKKIALAVGLGVGLGALPLWRHAHPQTYTQGACKSACKYFSLMRNIGWNALRAPKSGCIVCGRNIAVTTLPCHCGLGCVLALPSYYLHYCHLKLFGCSRSFVVPHARPSDDVMMHAQKMPDRVGVLLLSAQSKVNTGTLTQHIFGCSPCTSLPS
jgi:hypothetical protein